VDSVPLRGVEGEEDDPLLGLFMGDGLVSSSKARSSSVVLVAQGLGISEGLGLPASTADSSILGALVLLFVLEGEATELCN
jgi:hypothetical protein